MWGLFDVCSSCSANSSTQSSSVIICIDLFVQLLFYSGLAFSCGVELWQRYKEKQGFLSKKCHVLLSMCILSLIQLIYVGILDINELQTIGLFLRQLLFSCVFFLFLHKYWKLSDSKKLSTRKMLTGAFLSVVGIQLVLFSLNILGFDGLNTSQCSDLSGLWIRVVGTIIGFLFISLERGIKTFLDQEDKLEDLLSFVVVYAMTQFLMLCILIYLDLQVIDNENQPNAQCTILPPNYMDNDEDGRLAGDEALRMIINIVSTFLPFIYLFNLFKRKKSRTDYQSEEKRFLMTNEELTNGFGRYIKFNGKLRNRPKRNFDSQLQNNNNNHNYLNNDVSLSQSFLSQNNPNDP